MARVKICPHKIPAVDLRVLCSTVLDSVKKFYEDPEHQRQFEEWKRNKEETSNVRDQGDC